MGKKRGAPQKPPEQRKGKIFPIRLTQREYTLVETAAGDGKPSAWAREVLLQEIGKNRRSKRKAGESNPSA